MKTIIFPLKLNNETRQATFLGRTPLKGASTERESRQHDQKPGKDPKDFLPRQGDQNLGGHMLKILLMD